MTTNLQEIIRLAVEAERMANRIYLKYSQVFSDIPEIKRVFEQLVSDEVQHVADFYRAMRELKESDIEIPEDELDIFRALNPVRYLEMIDKDVGEVSQNDVVVCVYQFEKGTLLFYHRLEILMGKTELLSKLIDSQKSHLKIVLGYLCTDAKFKGISPEC